MKILVVDDEPLARRRLVRMLTRMPSVEVVGQAGGGEEALAKIRERAPDLVLLDIRMPGLSGLELAASAPDLPPIIFTTAYDEYALQAFEVSAVDYLMKPVVADRLERAIAKVRARRGGDYSARLRSLFDQLNERAPGAQPVRVSARQGDTVRVFDPQEISRFSASEKYTVMQHEGREYVLDESLSALEERLAPLGFVRVHRSELVNLHRVRALHSNESGASVELEDGERVPVSRRLVGELKRRLGVN